MYPKTRISGTICSSPCQRFLGKTKTIRYAWGNFGNFTYVLLKPGTNINAFNKKLADVYKKFVEPIFKQFNVSMRYDVQNITDIHLHSTLQ